MASQALDTGAWSADLQVLGPMPDWTPGQISFLQVSVRNDSPHAWETRGSRPIHLSSHWRAPDGTVEEFDGNRALLPRHLAAGEGAAIDLPIRGPRSPGRWLLELDLVQEHVAWFADWGSPPWRREVEVRHEPRTHRLTFTGTATEREFNDAVAEQDWWYHSYYFDNGFAVEGDYDVGRNIHEYGFPSDLSGKSVLDIGGGSGWFAHFFAQRGARVTMTDIRGLCDYDAQGRVGGYPPVESVKPRPDVVDHMGRGLYFSRVSRGMWIMRRLLDSGIRYVNARAYEIRPELFDGEQFDLVFVGALLQHLRDPVGALQAARSVCRERLVATTGLSADPDDDVPRMELHTGLAFANWWFPNRSCYARWFLDAGFRTVDVQRMVTLTGEAARPSFEDPGMIRNESQRLCLADAQV